MRKWVTKNGKWEREEREVGKYDFFSILGTSSCSVMMPPWKNIADQLRYEMKIEF